MLEAMFDYDKLVWTIFFPVFCSLAMWFSIVLALLLRSDAGCARRETARRTILDIEHSGMPVPASFHRYTKAVLRRAIVVVGGDFARSPRMQYHAASLAKSGMFDEVVLVGFDMGNTLIHSLESMRSSSTDTDFIYLREHDPPREEYSCIIDTSCLIPPITPPPFFRFLFPHPRLYWVMSTLYRMSICAVVFAWLIIRASLMVVNKHGQLLLADLILVQLPPAVPFVPIIKYLVRPCVLIVNTILYYCFIIPASWMKKTAFSEIHEGLKLQQELKENKNRKTSSRLVMCPALIVDWHNFGFTIMQNDGRPSIMVWIYRFFECNLCIGNGNVTVSQAMRTALCQREENNASKEIDFKSKKNQVVVLYDTAPSFFGPCSRSQFVEEVLTPMLQLTSTSRKEVMGLSPPPAFILNDSVKEEDSSLGNTGRKGLFMIASTSWTPDDDYTMVIDALVRIDKRLQKQLQEEGGKTLLHPVRSIWLLVTGKGISRERFEKAVIAAHLSPLVMITTVYFQSYQHYAMALGAADVGLCMHRSSSGLDLPMKAVDMLGSGLPVVALRYDALSELLDKQHGWLFSNAEELEHIIWHYLLSYNTASNKEESLEIKRRHVMESRRETWDDKWNSAVLPLLQRLL
ncbi:glycosyltransferase [Trypanosoma theileri]|uniref:Glycosyltransferase n=1 Tax=Trypanosoma theileri TaxID=67003 RepID=A0A1X0P7S9_9TRYP|nr:glycosyltransferase [Trypanosoma theileri]ORC92683.1 glycosyltransferase [Trypanosoma theileri]